MAPIGIGMIGAGMIGQIAYLASFSLLDGCRLVALAELRPELGRKAAEKFGVPKVYPDHHALLADPEVDAVIVVTRRHATGPIVLDALNAGKHVLSEKPMAHTTDQGNRLVAAAEGGLCYAIGYMKRFDPGVQEGKRTLERLIREKTLGDIVTVRAYCFGGNAGRPTDGFVMTDEPRPDGLEVWPLGPAWLPVDLIDDYDGFLNVNVHILNIVRYLLDQTPSITVVDFNGRNRTTALSFDGFEGFLDLGDIPSEDWSEGVEVGFERGRLLIEFPPPLRQGDIANIRIQREKSSEFETLAVTETGWSFRRQAEAFVEDVRIGREPLASGADSLHDLELAEDIWLLHLENSR